MYYDYMNLEIVFGFCRKESGNRLMMFVLGAGIVVMIYVFCICFFWVGFRRFLGFLRGVGLFLRGFWEKVVFYGVY